MNTLSRGTKSLIILIFIFAMVAPAYAQSPAQPDTITVTGSGTAFGSPEIATVQIGVETFDTSITNAFAGNNETINAVINALIEQGIAREDIRTSNLGIYQDRSMMMPGQEGQVSYIVSNQVNVTVRDISNIANVIDTAVSNGANSIYGLDFRFSNPMALESTARSNAVEDARARAGELAALIGGELDEVVSVVEVTGGYSPFDGGRVMQEGIGGSGAVVEPGQLSVAIQVQVTFSIRR